MNTEKKILQYVFLIFFAALTGYTFLLRASFYNEEGLPRSADSSFRVMGENLAGDYALFRLLEKDKNPKEAYLPENQSAFLYKAAHVEDKFVSFAAPTKSFVIVPWLSLPYDVFYEMWLFWGLFLFGVALYALFPITQALLLMFALPVGFLSFTTGGWGLYMAAGVILALSLADDHPKWAGFFGALCIIEPLVFLFVCAGLFLRPRKLAGLICLIGGGVITWLALARYGFGAGMTALGTAGEFLYDKPCLFSSVFGVVLCGGYSLTTAIVWQTVCGMIALCVVVRLFQKSRCPQLVKNAALCVAACLVSPLIQAADYALLYAGIAFLLKDSSDRGFLKGDLVILTAAFASIFLETYFYVKTGVSVQLVLSAAVLFLCYRRRY